MKYSNLFRKIVRNKKGLDPDFTDVIIATIFTAVIFIFAFIFISYTNLSIEKAIEEESNNLEKDYILLNYLRTPIQGKGMNIAEYLGSLDKEKLMSSMGCDGFCRVKGLRPRAGCAEDGQLTKETKEILKDIKDWRVEMHMTGGEKFCSIEKGTQQQRGVSILGETVKAIIPSNDLSFNIEIYFKFKS